MTYRTLVAALTAAALLLGGCSSDAADPVAPDPGPDAEGDTPADPDPTNDAGDPGGSPHQDSGPDLPLPPGVFEGADVTDTTTIEGLGGPVSVVTDSRGVPHIYADTLEDLMYGLAWAHCRDRLGQMVLAKRSSTGTLAELLGGLDAGLVQDDILTRHWGFERVAQQMYDALPAGSIEKRALDAYAKGVNAYLAKLRAGELKQPSPLDIFLPAELIGDWRPIDALVIGRLQAHELSWDCAHEVGLTARIQAILDAFPADDPDPARSLRAGWMGDVFGFSPADPTVQYPDYPLQTPASMPIGLVKKPNTRRPKVGPSLLERAARATRQLHLFTQPGQRGASNNWVVAPEKTANGHALVCNDPHLGLDNPPIFYFARLVLPESAPDGAMDVIGGNFPGIPGFLIGHNRHVAWGLTTAADDRCDAYLEDFSGGETPTVMREGSPAEVTVIKDTIKVGNLGEPTGEVPFEILLTPEGRVLVPDVAGDQFTPLATGEQLSYAWQGLYPTPEISVVVRSLQAESAAELTDILRGFYAANQNVVGADIDGNIFAISPAGVPLREPGATTWDPDTHPEGTAPWMVLPADGADWTGLLSTDQAFVVTDPAAGFIVTANNDHFGQTLDNNPLNEPVYVGYEYAVGYRAGRITRMLEAAGDQMTLDTMLAIQTDNYSALGDALRDPLLAEVDKMIAELDAPGTHPDLGPLAAEYADLEESLRDARDRIAAWSLHAPAGVDERGATPSAEEKADAVATTLFNVWLVKLFDQAFGDEQAAIGVGARDLYRVRGMVRIVNNQPDDVATLDPETGESILWDRLDTDDVKETRAHTVVTALYRALEDLPSLFPDAASAGDYLWGELHRLTLDSLLPIPGGALDLPGPDDGDLFGKGFARPGDQYSVNVCNGGLGDTKFTCGSGPIMRFCVELDPAGPRSFQMIPGGQSFDRQSPHYRDWLDDWLDHNARYWTTTSEALADDVDTHTLLAPAN